MQIDIEALTTPRERGVIGGFKVDAHQRQDRAQKAFRLAQWQIEEEPQRQSCFDREFWCRSALPSLYPCTNAGTQHYARVLSDGVGASVDAALVLAPLLGSRMRGQRQVQQAARAIVERVELHSEAPAFRLAHDVCTHR
jgi:hypothetical protein